MSAYSISQISREKKKKTYRRATVRFLVKIKMELLNVYCDERKYEHEEKGETNKAGKKEKYNVNRFTVMKNIL